MSENEQVTIENQETTQEKKLSLRQVMASLPRVLFVEVMKRFGAALLVLVVTIAMLLNSGDWMYCIGFLLCLGAAYLGMDIVWKYGSGKIVVARMVVCKASTRLRHMDKVHVILRDASVQDLVGADYETYKFDLPVTIKNRGNITAGTILDIYISETNPYAVLAYEILGEV